MSRSRRFHRYVQPFWPLPVGGRRSGDNTNYIAIAKSIRHWNFAGLTPKLFWGTSYATEAFSGLFQTPERISLLLLSMIRCLGALWLARNLWDGWVAAFFMALNFDWMQRSFLGGSEPLFVLLIFASLLLPGKSHGKPRRCWRR